MVAANITIDDATKDKLKKMVQPEAIVDGCTAAVHVAYACSDTTFIFPITPSSSMAETADLFCHQGRKNVFGQLLGIRQMQSEAGAAGAMHGGLVMGSCSTTFTASQGLLLMIPNMYKISGELMPCVMHVAARAVATQALSIFGDHSDVMAVRSCGWAMLSSASVQEAGDLALIAHIATFRTRVPFVHFFDGFRTSHELQKIKLLPYELISDMLPWGQIDEHRNRGLNPTRPIQIGTAQGPEILFQNVEAANQFYNAVPGVVDDVMQVFGEVVGRKYKLFQYYGAPDAERAIVIMGASTNCVMETIDYLMDKGEKVGMVAVHLYRPWSLEHFMAAFPDTVNRIAVLDRTKESGSLGEPLFLDTSASFQTSDRNCLIIAGRYGLASKDFTPQMVATIYDELAKPKPRKIFTIGINDDVTHLSLDYSQYTLNTVPKGTIECMFWGMGSDGTVGANKNVIKILGDNTDMKVQGYFAYSAHKAGGITVSHLRFGPSDITSQYLIQQSDYLAVHRDKYIKQFRIPQYIKEGGTLVLNCHWNETDLETEIPGVIRRQIAQKNIKLYIVDAGLIAKVTGMGRRINSILMTVFFKLSGVLPMEQAISLFKSAIRKTYGRKGEHVVEMNHRAVDAACDAVVPVNYNRDQWLHAPIEKTIEHSEKAPDFVTSVLMAVEKMEGDDIPVSTVMPHVGGTIPLGTAAYEKRGIALTIPIVDMNKCTQCNYCAFVCPHAAIRPFLVNEDEAEDAPEGFIMKKAKGQAELGAFRYRIQVAPQDCTGCTLCAIACPDDALTMMPYEDHAHKEDPNWDFGIKLENRGDLIGTQSRHTLKGSQFQQPLMEFSGACEGCGETPYVKLLTQLFGERMVIANATGCTSIWGASYPSTPYTTNKTGHGPAWGNSLFEDNAEYGFGMVVAYNHRRQLLHSQAEAVLAEEGLQISTELRELLQKWVDDWRDADACQLLFDDLSALLKKEKDKHPFIERLSTQNDIIPKFSQWMIGGDGWAYDIGYGGLDHVLASGENVNIMVLDTEVYSNTGGQISKATPMGAVHKFGMGGHLRNKKDLGMMAMEYGNVYVACCSELANMSQTVRAILEAEAFDGPSLLLCYAPCIEHQYIKPFSMQQMHCRMAVDCGYWPLYRYDPTRLLKNENPFQLDAKKLRGDIKELLHKENRFETLWRENPELAEYVEGQLAKWCHERFDKLQLKAEGYDTATAKTAFGAMQAGVNDDTKINILYGSETGNTEEVARRVLAMLKERSVPCAMTEFIDIDVEDVAEMKNVLMLCCTQGQGEFPEDTRKFWSDLSSKELAPDTMAGVTYGVFGLGDSSYIYFNQAAKNLDQRFAELGAKRLLPVGEGDDQHAEKYDGALGDWLPDYFTEIKAPEPKTSEFPDPPLFKATPLTTGTYAQCKPQGAQFVEITTNKRMTPNDYEVDIRHMEFNLAGSGYKYQLGDSLQIWGQNDPAVAEQICAHFGYNPDQWVKLEKAGEDGSIKHEVLFKNPLTIRQILAECLDILGRPTRRFYEVLWKHCKDPAEKAKAKTILDKENKATLSHMTNKMLVSMWDIFKMYPSAKPSLEELVDLVPLIRPRAYSIASSQKFVGDDALHLCVGIVDWKTEAGELRLGHTTGYITRTYVGDGRKVYFATALKATAFNMPPSNANPMIMAGMGTGLAPFRGFIQHRAWLKRSGKPVGPTVLYFGCRYKNKDFLYKDELEAFAAEGVLTDLKTAFSRDQKEKFYVQHAIDQDPELIYKRLVTETGYFYLCGTAKQVPIDVRAAVERAIVKCEKISPEEASKKVTDMLIQGQYNMEAW